MSALEAIRRLSYATRQWIGVLLIICSIGYMTWQIGVESVGSVPDNRSGIGELVALIGSIAGSFLASRNLLRGHARSAFRRLLSLYGGLEEIAKTAACESPMEQSSTLTKIAAIASVHYETARDALEDWSDLAPQEVAELKDRLAQRSNSPVERGEEIRAPALERGAVTTHEGSDHG